MFKVTITMGIEVDKFGEDVVLGDLEHTAIQDIQTEICKKHGGYTKTRHMGGYCYENGDLVEERAVSISFITESFKMEELHTYAARYREIYEQQSVMLTIEDVRINKFV